MTCKRLLESFSSLNQPLESHSRNSREILAASEKQANEDWDFYSKICVCVYVLKAGTRNGQKEYGINPTAIFVTF